MGNKIATREAYGKALVKLSNMNDKVVEFENLTKQNRFMEKQLKHLLKLAFAE